MGVLPSSPPYTLTHARAHERATGKRRKRESMVAIIEDGEGMEEANEERKLGEEKRGSLCLPYVYTCMRGREGTSHGGGAKEIVFVAFWAVLISTIITP